MKEFDFRVKMSAEELETKVREYYEELYPSSKVEVEYCEKGIEEQETIFSTIVSNVSLNVKVTQPLTSFEGKEAEKEETLKESEIAGILSKFLKKDDLVVKSITRDTITRDTTDKIAVFNIDCKNKSEKEQQVSKKIHSIYQDLKKIL